MTRPRPYVRDWSTASGELRGQQGTNPARLRFEAIMDEMRACFRTQAMHLPKSKGKSRRAIADEEFFAWNRPFFHDVSSDTEWKSLFFPYSGEDKRAAAVAELDGWLQHVKAKPDTYPSPASLVRSSR